MENEFPVCGSYGKVSSISITSTNIELQDTQCVFCTCFANFSMKKERKKEQKQDTDFILRVIVVLLLLLC